MISLRPELVTGELAQRSYMFQAIIYGCLELSSELVWITTGFEAYMEKFFSLRMSHMKIYNNCYILQKEKRKKDGEHLEKWRISYRQPNAVNIP